MRGIAFGQSRGSEHGRVPRKLSRVKDLQPKASPSGLPAAKSVSLGLPHDSKHKRVPRNHARAKD